MKSGLQGTLVVLFVLCCPILGTHFMRGQAALWEISGGLFLLGILGLCAWRIKAFADQRFTTLALFVSLAMWCLVPVLRGSYYAYYRGGLDIAWYAQAVWKVSQGQEPIVTTVLPLHHLANHCEPIIYVLGFIYRIFFINLLPTYLFLYLSQLVANMCLLCMSGIWLFRNGANPGSLSFGLIALLFTNHFGFIAANQFEFHPPTFGLSLFILALGFYSQKKRFEAVILALMASLCGEFFIIIGLTSAVFFCLRPHRPWRRDIPVIAAGFIGSCLLLLLYFKIGRNYFAVTGNFSDFVGERYAVFGSSVVDLILAPILQTNLFFSTIFTTEKTIYLAKISLPLALILGLSWKLRVKPVVWSMFLTGFLLCLAPLAKILLSNYSSYLRNDVHYAADILPGFILMSYAVVAAFDLKPAFQSFSTWFILCIFCAFQAGFGPIPLLVSPIEKRAITAEMRSWFRSIDTKIAVYSDNDVFSAELAGREQYFSHFSDTYLQGASLPDIVILSWPPEHFNQGRAVLHSFRKSFIMQGSTMTSHYGGTLSTYKIIQSFPSEEYGSITAWARQPSGSATE